MDAAQARRNRLPFKPPRIQSAGTSSSAAAGRASSTKTASTSKVSKQISSARTAAARNTLSKSTASKKKPSKAPQRGSRSIFDPTSEESNDTDATDEDAGPSRDSRSSSPFQEPDYILAEIITNDRPRDIESDEPRIPPKLLTTILHHHFKNSKTKITKDANEVVAKYMDIFVREALARAAYERADASTGDGRTRPGDDGFLEVGWTFFLFL